MFQEAYWLYCFPHPVARRKSDYLSPITTLRIQRVVTAKTATGLRVHGRVTANHPQYLPAGHVDITILAADGSLIDQTTATLRPQSLSRRAKRKGGVRFSAEVVGDVPSGSTVKLAYHRVGTDAGAETHRDQVI